MEYELEHWVGTASFEKCVETEIVEASSAREALELHLSGHDQWSFADLADDCAQAVDASHRGTRHNDSWSAAPAGRTTADPQ